VNIFSPRSIKSYPAVGAAEVVVRSAFRDASQPPLAWRCRALIPAPLLLNFVENCRPTTSGYARLIAGPSRR